MKIKQRGDFIELNVIIEKFKTKIVPVKKNGKVLKDENGNRITQEIDEYKGEILVPTNFCRESIRPFGATPNHRYRVQKTKSTIYDRDSQKFYVVKHTLDELDEALRPRPIVGFQIGRNK